LYRLERRHYPILDRFEGCGRGYETFWLDLNFQDKAIEVLTYLTPSHWRLDAGLPYDWYRELVLLGARHHEFPTEVQQAIAAVPAMPDPDPKRAAFNRRLIEQLGRS
jgi:gamma-glutamylcyclotransferase